MNPLPFDPEDPPDEPPDQVRQPMLWRLAVGLHREHRPDPASQPSHPLCRMCRAPWPCLARRAAQRGLWEAFHDPPHRRPARWFAAPRDGWPDPGDGGTGR